MTTGLGGSGGHSSSSDNNDRVTSGTGNERQKGSSVSGSEQTSFFSAAFGAARVKAHTSALFVPAPLPALPIEMLTLDNRQARAAGQDEEGAQLDPLADDDDDVEALDAFAGGYTAYLGRLTAVACLGGLQFGWDTGVAAGMLVAIHEDLGHTLSAKEQEVIVSATTVGAILGALFGGRLSDWMGRKKVMILAGTFFALGSIEQAASQVVRELVLGRLIVGLGVGMASMVVPTYLGECAPPSVRGRIVAINSLLITGGQVMAYVVNAAFYRLPHGWRWMVLAGGLPAIVQLIGLIYLDESPRWLIARGRHTAARHVLMRIYPLASAATITAQVNKIEANLNRVDPGARHTGRQSDTSVMNKSNDFKDQMHRLWNERANRKALFIACGLQASQQLIGANSILYYSSRLLLMAGFHANPNVAAIWIAVANFIGTALALRLVDRMGRRTLLLRATAAATVALAFLAIALSQIDTGDVTDGERPNVGTDAPALPAPSAWTYLCLIAMVFFLFFYALGLGIVPWLVQSEIFAGSVRGVGGGLATATNWSMNLLTSATFLDLMRLITPQGCFGFYSGVGAITWAFAYTQLPELMGVSIDDVQAALDGTSGYAAVRADEHGEDDEDEDNRQRRTMGGAVHSS